jgi:hypothetical protein
MRNMSFSMTTEAVRNQTKTVTRRLGWDFLELGDLLCAVEKCQGLKKGEKVQRLAVIRVVSTRWERLFDMGRNGPLECAREGFPDLSPCEFTAMFCRANQCGPGVDVNRIEFEYVPGGGE